MKAYILSDEAYKTAVYEKLSAQVVEFLRKRDFETEQKSIKTGELHFCIGCYGCWTRKPGECVINDHMAQINRTFNSSDVVIYLCPIVFGQYSPNIKHALDRWLPNILPLFVKKSDGTTGHPQRYMTVPKQVVIGYGDAISQEEARLFTNIVRRRQNVDVFLFSDKQSEIANNLTKVKLERVNG